MPQWLSEPHVTMLRLDRMVREQCHAIISGVIGDKALPREVEEQIINKADGIPLFVEELAKSVLESELVQDVGDRDITAGPLPPSPFQPRCSTLLLPDLTGSVRPRKSPRSAQSLVANFPSRC